MHLLLRSLVDRFTDLADNAQAFMGSLQRSTDLHDADAFSALFLRLIGDALAARRPGERSVGTITADGSMRIRLTTVDGATRGDPYPGRAFPRPRLTYMRRTFGRLTVLPPRPLALDKRPTTNRIRQRRNSA